MMMSRAFLLFFALVLISFSASVHAQGIGANEVSNLGQNAGITFGLAGGKGAATTVQDAVIRVLELLLQLVGIVALAIFLWGGFRYLTSLGDETKAAAAKKIILYAVIGMLIIGGSLLLLSVVGELLTGQNPVGGK